MRSLRRFCCSICWVQGQPMTDAQLLPAGAAADMPAGGRKLVFQPSGETILLLNVDGHYYALENSCPHAGASLANGSCAGHVLTCPAHGLKFDIRNGQCTVSSSMKVPRFEVPCTDGLLWINPAKKCSSRADSALSC